MGKPEDQKEEPDEEKEQQRLIGTPGPGALRTRGMPVAVTPPTLKNERGDAQNVVMTATEIAGELEASEPPPNDAAWRNLAQINPRTIRAGKRRDPKESLSQGRFMALSSSRR